MIKEILWLSLSLTLFGIGSEAVQGNSLDQTGALWAPYLEWGLDNPGWSGNPFDLEATATFTHGEGGEVRTTKMFYDGGDTWKFRFAGTRTGQWTFTTTSGAESLNGLGGTVTITPNPDPRARGFLVGAGNKWARQLNPSGAVQAFVPQLVMYESVPKNYHNNPGLIDAAIDAFITGHGFNGFHLPSVGGQWFDRDAGYVVTSNMQNPDPRTFEALELLISKTHAAGGMVHIWPWGDQFRRWTPIELSDGMNGVEDKRLQRYMAARLGAIAGWSMGFGFDLFEWAPSAEVVEWRDFLQSELGWFHFLGGRPGGPRSGTDHSDHLEWNQPLDYSSYEHHHPDYNVYVAALAAVPGQPVFSEDRFRLRDEGREKDYTMEQVRRGLWQSTLAGGVANIWGNLLDVASPDDGSGVFPNPEWIKTYSMFFSDDSRFSAVIAPANSLTAGTNAHALATPTRDNIVIYAEDTDSVQLNLAGLDARIYAVAVDTKSPYAEIVIGWLEPVDQVWNAPGLSDWAFAMGSPNNDLNSDGLLDDTDIDLLRDAILSMTTDAKFNVDGIGGNVPDEDDFDFYITSESMQATGSGDGDLNKIVNFNDFVLLTNNFGSNGSGWSQGNYNADTNTNFDDFVLLSNNFEMNFTVRPTPEPTALAMLYLGSLAALPCRRSQLT